MTVAQHGHGVGDPQDFAQEMRDEHDRPAPRPEGPDRLVQVGDLVASEGGARLVEHDQLGVTGDRPQDLDLLLVGGAQAPGYGVGGDPEAHRVAQLGVAAVELASPYQAACSRLDSEVDVLGCRQLGDDRQFLGDRGDPVHEGLAGAAEPDGPAAQQHRPVVRGDDPADDLAKSRLAGAVLSDERVHRARLDSYRYRLECTSTAEMLGDLVQLHVGRTGLRCCSHSVRRLSPATRRGRALRSPW